jgi:parallel beta-helix repeat protein
LQPGDVATVHAGIYAPVSIKVSGTAAGGPVTFRSATGETAIIDGNGLVPSAEVAAGADALLLIDSRKYVVVDGFELRNFKTADALPTPAGIFLDRACQHIKILNCNIHDIVNTGGHAGDSGNAFGLAVYGRTTTAATDIVIQGNNVHDLMTGSSESVVLNGNVTAFQVLDNQIHDNNNIGIDFAGYEKVCRIPALDRARAGLCRGNTVWNISSQNNQAYTDGDFSADGIYCDGSANIVIEGNISHDNDIGIELASEHAGRFTQGIVVRDNFVYRSRQCGLLLGGYKQKGVGGTYGCTIRGNTFFDNDRLGWGNGEAQLRFRTYFCAFRSNIFSASAGKLCVTVPVGTSDNVGNTLSYDLYYAGGAEPLWSWNNRPASGLAAWQRLSRQDAPALVADPQFVSTATPDLHVGAASPAIDAGPPGYKAAKGETDLDGDARVNAGRVDIGADEQAAAQ